MEGRGRATEVTYAFPRDENVFVFRVSEIGHIIRWGCLFRNVPRSLHTLEDSSSDEGWGDIHGPAAIGIPLASSP
eukprot:2392273-Pyramimonas_sp.AAC.1